MKTQWRLFTSLVVRLLSPVNYLRVNHAQKSWADIWIPLMLGIVATLILAVLPSPVKITGDGGLMEIFTGLLQILTGFYIASLTAIATFDRESMDQVMAGTPPTLRVRLQGIWETEMLTRRRFLGLMFGYLSLLSFVLYFFGAFVDLLEPNIVIALSFLSPPYIDWVKWICIGLYLCFVANLVVTTLLGLYYMTERIHRDAARIFREPL